MAKFVGLHVEGDGKVGGRERILGFTVSHPVDDLLPSSALHSKWRRLSVNDAVGEELAQEMNHALKKHGIEMRVFAVVNATIGHLAGGRYYNKESVAAVSLGMGSDVTYIESLPQQIVKESSPEAAETAINMRWGNFFSSHLPLTEYDASLDAQSADPGCRVRRTPIH
ncbi:hypothetical protein SASPL_143930 [Salvia splendens]|uniref:Phosphotransferase n=1 Tax=Salvia splendens TaxID=180675 RepID=A0A8X8WNJ0_SALSN|nr:hypothetical protein SASPL_143930 [Salvia splendens]